MQFIWVSTISASGASVELAAVVNEERSCRLEGTSGDLFFSSSFLFDFN